MELDVTSCADPLVDENRHIFSRHGENRFGKRVRADHHVIPLARARFCSRSVHSQRQVLV